MRTLLLLAITLTACTSRKHEAEPSASEKHQLLSDAFNTRLAALDEVIDADGLPTRDDCDLLLWAGEAAYAGVAVTLDLFEYRPGELHRRPEPACWTPKGGDQGSKSTISQDMLYGYMLGRWRQGDLVAFQRLANYGEKRPVALPIPGWKMGEPFPDMATRVVLRANGIGVASRAIYVLSAGADNRGGRSLPPAYVPVTEDYERHIQALGILLDGLVAEAHRKNGLSVYGSQSQLIDVTGNEYETLKSLVAAEPQNAFFHAILGRYEGEQAPAIDLLLNAETPTPSYVRGHASYTEIHWLAAARTVLDSLKEEP